MKSQVNCLCVVVFFFILGGGDLDLGENAQKPILGMLQLNS